MAVYVDELFEWPIDCVANAQARRLAVRYGGKWCHMWADSREELVAFAKRIGLKPEWIQRSARGFVHFDLVPPKRVKALQLGAIVKPTTEIMHR